MKFPDHEFEEHLRKARLAFSCGATCIRIAGHTLPASSEYPNKIDSMRFGYSTWLFWMEAFDNAQREAVQKKLVALRVAERLGGT